MSDKSELQSHIKQIYKTYIDWNKGIGPKCMTIIRAEFIDPEIFRDTP